MTDDEPAAEGRRAPRGASWPWPGRSIRPGLRAEKRVQRFLDAALELMIDALGQGVHRPGGRRAVRPVAAQLLPVLRREVRAAAGPLRGVGPLHGRAPRERGRRGGRPARAPPPLRGRVLPAVPAGAEDRAEQEGPAPAMARVRPAAAHRAPQGGGPGLRARGGPVRASPRRGRGGRRRPPRAPPRPDRRRRAARRSCSTSSRRRSAALSLRRDEGDAGRGALGPDPPRHRSELRA